MKILDIEKIFKTFTLIIEDKNGLSTSVKQMQKKKEKILQLYWLPHNCHFLQACLLFAPV